MSGVDLIQKIVQIMKDSIGDRMKDQYENRTRYMLPRRTYTIIRVDGKAFHSFTRHCDKPNDERLATALDTSALVLCRESQGSCFAYIQSDEISILLTDFAIPSTEAWFDGNIQKICSVAASIITAEFAHIYRHMKQAHFDARVFTIPDPIEVENYFIWRQQDAVRNSIQGLAQSYFSHGQLKGLDCNQLQELLFQEKGVNWNDAPAYWKRGRCVIKNEAGWVLHKEIPIFTAERDYLTKMIPKIWTQS
jgi:tRNA(His) guanylyltransferase